MIKMRQWNQSLRHDSPFQFHKIPDVGADVTYNEEVYLFSVFVRPERIYCSTIFGAGNKVVI